MTFIGRRATIVMITIIVQESGRSDDGRNGQHRLVMDASAGQWCFMERISLSRACARLYWFRGDCGTQQVLL